MREQALLQRLQHVCAFDVLECNTVDPADLNDARRSVGYCNHCTTWRATSGQRGSAIWLVR